MIKLRQRDQRGHFDHGWLNTYHSFSFASYYDPQNMGFRSLRVINEDRVQPAMGFGTHGHQDMEILTYVLEGGLAHKDSLGNGAIIRPGELQRMTAGTGIRHSEANASKDELVHFYQIWILPEKEGLKPGYEQRQFSDAERNGKLKLLASRDGRDGSMTINQDASVYSTLLAPGESTRYTLAPERHAWVQVARGAVTLNGSPLKAGDGAAVSQEAQLELSAQEPSDVLLFDLA
jgi:redox-sensitive bicupin YhaK (pirin superfamily)